MEYGSGAHDRGRHIQADAAWGSGRLEGCDPEGPTLGVPKRDWKLKEDWLAYMSTEHVTSPELTGGAGYTYEDAVVAYYLAGLLREEGAVGQIGVVTGVAVQQAPAYPLDDLVVQFDDQGTERMLSLQVKRSVVISGAAANDEFGRILSSAAATLADQGFRVGSDAYGFVVEHAALRRWRDLERLIHFAKSSTDVASFERRFNASGSASRAVRKLREDLAPSIAAGSSDQEWQFYRHFVALRLDGLQGDGPFATELANRLRELDADASPSSRALGDVLCNIARQGAASARSWTRELLLSQLRGKVLLSVAPSYASDMARIESWSRAAMAGICDEVAGVRVDRPDVVSRVREQMGEHRLVNLSGLAGTGKSAALKHVAETLSSDGPLLFLKHDRIESHSWATFAQALGLEHSDPAQILAEMGTSGTPILFIDGIDRIDPACKRVVLDIVRAIEDGEHLDHWTVLASSRNQGLEGYRTWFPASFYRGAGVGDVTVGGFDDDEALQLAQAVPALSSLLSGAESVAAIARRPFFAAVLARSSETRDASPQTEIDLVGEWWRGGGYDGPRGSVVQRQRALLDVAEHGLRTLGRKVPTGKLRDATQSQVESLVKDGVLQSIDDGAWHSFAHDIFFEWVFYRRLVECGGEWAAELARAGEPPLLGRVVALLAQKALGATGVWSAGYRELETKDLRPQWRREWLTAPPFTSAFSGARQEEFAALLAEDDHHLLGKFLLWSQAQHTTPNPQVLAGVAVAEEADRLQFADLLGWPSDVAGWARLLGWLIPAVPTLPRRFAPAVVQVFAVWQNLFANVPNAHSATIVEICHGWLVELEEVLYGPQERSVVADTRWADLGGGKSDLATALRLLIARSASTYPEPVSELYARAAEWVEMRRTTYGELMAFASAGAAVSPEALADVAKAELIEELPGDRLARRRREQEAVFAHLRRIREKPAAARTPEEQRALDHPHFPVGEDRVVDRDDIGIKRFESYYSPPSPAHEPFAALFTKAPETALALVRDLANHAVRGWRQNKTCRGADSPVPVTLGFPWGEQTFWGDVEQYKWFTIHASPEPLECAFLALRHWAFKELDGGRPVDEVIRAVVEGNTCYGVLGLALALALETLCVSETVLPVVTCQRLWHDDLPRFAHESMSGIDLLGFGLQSPLPRHRAAARDFLNSRQHRTRRIEHLAVAFATGADSAMRERFLARMARFPDSLPYTTEAQREDARVTAYLGEHARRWAEYGDAGNYRRVDVAGRGTGVGFESPTPRSEAEERRFEENAAALAAQSVIGWATRCLEAGAVVEGASIADAIRMARERDDEELFNERRDAVQHWPQTLVSVVGAVTLCSGDAKRADREWAWNVMDRVEAMREPADALPGSRIPWHPAGHLVAALAGDRRGEEPRADSASRLLRLTIHPLEDDVAKPAFAALLSDPDLDVRWVAGRLVLALSIRPRPDWSRHGAGSDAAATRRRAVEHAIGELGGTALPWPDLPAPWAKVARRLEYGSRAREWEEWGDPDPYFDAAAAGKLLDLFPVEDWCRSSVHAALLGEGVQHLVGWTATKLLPDWAAAPGDDAVRRAATSLIEWNDAFGRLLARTAPFLDADVVRRAHLDPFRVDDDDSFSVLAAFISHTVVRHVVDAPTIADSTLTLLDDCVDRVLEHPSFLRGAYGAGELSGWSLPKAVSALLFVPFDQKVLGSLRFANGDWSEVGAVMPVVSKLIARLAWSRDVMERFLQLCERAGDDYPLEAFADQVAGAAEAADHQWSGTTIPARIAATIQRLADANYPIKGELAQRLLFVLDALVELGDRRSVALEQLPAFRVVQGGERGD